MCKKHTPIWDFETGAPHRPNPVDYWYQKYLKEKLTWKDIELIDQIMLDLSNAYATGNFEPEAVHEGEELGNEFYQETLKRFNEAKGR